MVRFGNVILAYFVLGAVMWGGGAIAWSESGVGTLFIDDPQTGETNDETAGQLSESGGPIQQAVTSVGGGAVIAVYNLLVRFFGYLFWPITTLSGLNAPPSVVVLLGGTPTVAFFGAIIQIIRGST